MFILITLSFNAMAIRLMLPVMPELIHNIISGTLGIDAIWGGILTMAFVVMPVIFGSIFGSLSDRYGQSPVLLVSLQVMTMDYLVMTVAGFIWCCSQPASLAESPQQLCRQHRASSLTFPNHRENLPTSAISAQPLELISYLAPLLVAYSVNMPPARHSVPLLHLASRLHF